MRNPGVQVLLSCVSSEFLEYREIVRRKLRRPQLVALVQEEFVPDGTSTLEMLEQNILACHAVIHIAGRMTGSYADSRSVDYVRQRYPDLLDRLPALAPVMGPGSTGMSYTQWEAWLALYHRKRLYLAVPMETSGTATHTAISDMERAAQDEHIERLERSGCYVALRFTNAFHLAQLALDTSLRELEIAAAIREQSESYEVVAPFAFGARPPGALPLIPGFLSKVIDREEQGRVIRAALQKLHADNENVSRPFVFLVSGTNLDGQEGLIEMYQHDILRDFLGNTSASRRLQYSPVVWPPSGYEVRDLKRDLSKAVLLGNQATDADLNTRLVSGQGAQSLAYFVESGQWSARDEKLLLDWIDFWAAFPVLPKGKIVSVFLCMQHSTSKWQWLERRRIERFFGAVRSRFGTQPQIIRLSPLQPIELEHVIRWANFVVPTKAPGTTFDPVILKSEGIKPFASGRQHIHFDVLEPVLRSALDAAHSPIEAGSRPWN